MKLTLSCHIEVDDNVTVRELEELRKRLSNTVGYAKVGKVKLASPFTIQIVGPYKERSNKRQGQ